MTNMRKLVFALSVCFLMLTSPLSTDSYFALIILNIFEPRLETIHTNTHTDRFVAWRRLACLNASSSHLCNNMLVTLTLKYANTHMHTHAFLKMQTYTETHTGTESQLLHKYTSPFRFLHPVKLSSCTAGSALSAKRPHTPRQHIHLCMHISLTLLHTYKWHSYNGLFTISKMSSWGLLR